MQSNEEARPRILIVDDEQDMRWTLSTLAKQEGLEPVEAGDGQTALEVLQREAVDAAVLDLHMPGMDGMEFLQLARRVDPRMPIVILTAFGSIGSAIEAMKYGAFDYVVKPFDAGELRSVIRNAVRERQRHRTLPVHPEEGERPWECLGGSLAMRELASEVDLVAPTDYTVLITGETGTGKEVVARAVHVKSRRCGGPFVPVDCGSIPPTLIESELFGHEKGSFTGAVRSRPGCFEVASGGTLFLDEISNLPLDVQPKLLRALQERRISRVGRAQLIKLDIRVIAATNRSLATMVDEGSFRQDLYYRLNEFSLVVPPLRERREDIIFFAKRFLDESKTRLAKDIQGISEDGLEMLLSYEWPGNVRELKNVIRRAALRCGSYVRAEHLNIKAAAAIPEAMQIYLGGQFKGDVSLKDLVRRVTERVEREVIARSLRMAHGNKAEVARLLSVDYKTIHTKMKQYGITVRKPMAGRNSDG